MAKSYKPDAIILDIQLPVIDGWSVMGELKSSAVTRHIPVHVISVVDEVKQGLMMGAIAYLKKPSSREALEDAFTHIESYAEKSMKHLLIVEDDDIQRNSIIELIGHDDVSITAASTGAEALSELRKQRYDCMVLDLMLTDMTGFGRWIRSAMMRTWWICRSLFIQARTWIRRKRCDFANMQSRSSSKT